MRKQRYKKRMAALQQAKNKYVIGSSNCPEWCRSKLTPYRKMDGSTGYEFRGTEIDFELNAGDTLIMNDGRIKVKKAKRR